MQNTQTARNAQSVPKMEEVTFKDEIQKMEYEPLNAVEIALVRNSIAIGVVMLVVFYFISDWLFPGAHG